MIAERDPANIVGEKLFGKPLADRLVRALWGGGIENCKRRFYPSTLLRSEFNIGNMIRSFLDAIRIESATAPFDTIQCRVFYPARFGDTESERVTGVIPADADAPMPVVVCMQDVNISAFTVHWPMTELASHGFVVVLPEWMAQNLPGRTSFSPGIDFSVLKSETLGTRPSSLLLPSVVCQLKKWNEHGMLKNIIDTSRVIFGGHSAGGSMALLNVKRDEPFCKRAAKSQSRSHIGQDV